MEEKNYHLLPGKSNKNILSNDPYNAKKQSVVVLLAKILYGVVDIVLLGYGIYFTYMSHQDVLSQDALSFNKIAGEWNNTYVHEFKDWKISIVNNKNETIQLKKDTSKRHQYEEGHALFYDSFQFMENNLASLIKKLNLEKKKSDSSTESYNLTTTLYLDVDDTFSTRRLKLENVAFFIKTPSTKTQQPACLKAKGIWNYEDSTCYKFYMLRTVCIILDQKSGQLFADYKTFKCNGFNNWYESFSIFPWMIPSYDPNYDDIQSAGMKIGVYVSTNHDPFVWANYNGTLHFSNLPESYSIAGIWFITLAIAMLFIPILAYFKDVKDSNTIHPVNQDSSQDVTSGVNPILK